MEKYTFEEKTFLKGQKVSCFYYCEEITHPRRLFWFDKPFEPVKFGIICADAGQRRMHRPWYEQKDTEPYLWVKFKEYRFRKAIPVSCIEDITEYASRLESFMNSSQTPVGGHGNPIETHLWFLRNIAQARSFALKDF